ncbi:PPE family protein [Mycobacterium avium]|uniref:PPE family protein n=1 Tax=Mycobacterium avium TaxID=1764 RepID=UPI001CC60BCE|nr:PPE family protein [Mycobacterium avium]
MNFALQPPEITSAQLYTGPGAGPMLTAAAAWDALAAELQSAASSYAAVVNGLADEAWAGPSAAAMAAAAAPYVAWLAATSAQARTAAEQATAAASAFESAFAAVVPPAEIATNRARLAMLSASNVFGQNSAAIAAAEAEYGQMWAQDAAAMFGYASASAAATRLAPFTEPPKTTNDAGIAAQAAALGEATGRGAGTAAADATAPPSGIISQLLEALGNASRGYMDFWDQVLNTLTGSPLAGTTWQNTFGILADIGRFSTVANDSMSPINLAMTEFKMFYKLPVEGLDIPKSALGAGLGLRSAGAGLTGAVSVGVGEANTVGRLSVPPTWASATPAIRLASGLAPATAAAGIPAACSARWRWEASPGAPSAPWRRKSAAAGASGSARRSPPNPSNSTTSSPSCNGNRKPCSTGTSTRPDSTTCSTDCRKSPASMRCTCPAAANRP